ncbi:uncharacterized protein [Euwallacea fornicatus]|uniref:uncharacterized protein n=1 Tax=Euwallacea fornicatus TaxID=995702 RepID=UPI00338FFFB6
MSNNGSTSQSSGNSSSSQENVVALQIPDTSESNFIRSGTVVRRATTNVPFREDRVTSTSSTEDDDLPPAEKNRKESQYRHSLAAITEKRNIKHLAAEFGKGSRAAMSLDSSTAHNTTNDPPIFFNNLLEHEDKSVSHTSSSYLSWIERVNSEYFDSVVPNTSVQDVDNKVGEWNNFWLNYSNARLRHLSTEQTFSSDGLFEKTVDDQEEDRKSLASSQRDVTEKNSMEYVMLTMDEVQETLKCSQRISEILQNAMKRSEPDEGSNESYYSQQISCPLMASVGDDAPPPPKTSSVMLSRERSISCVDHQTLQLHQKQMLKPNKQSSSTSCIDAILNSGVGDILKKVVMKRRDVSASEADQAKSARNSFSDYWTIR